MPAPPGQSCQTCKYVVQAGTDPNYYYECHWDPSIITPQTNTWRTVKANDWCGQYRREGAQLSDQYLHGALALQDQTVIPLLTLTPGSITDSVVMKSCQLLNASTHDAVVLSFLDGPVAANVIGFTSCGPKTSKEVMFEPGLMATQGNDICVKLDQSIAPDFMYITAQGFMLGQVSAIIEVSEA